MTIHRIRQLGDPILRARCAPVQDAGSLAARIVVDDLQETLRDWQARHGFGRGIAAPQIGAPLRIIYLELERDVPWVLLNPEITDIGTDDFDVWDDCFSFQMLYVRVQRAYHIRVAWLDLKGLRHEQDFEGPAAELLQHEIDHLDGILAVDRPHGLDPFCFRDEWHRHHAHEGRCGQPHLREAVHLPMMHEYEIGPPRNMVDS